MFIIIISAPDDEAKKGYYRKKDWVEVCSELVQGRLALMLLSETKSNQFLMSAQPAPGEFRHKNT